MKVLDFETVSPLYEMERDGIKPFTCRLVDRDDSRFKSLDHWYSLSWGWRIRITNPNTGEQFTRRLVGYQEVMNIFFTVRPKWAIIFLGELIWDS